MWCKVCKVKEIHEKENRLLHTRNDKQENKRTFTKTLRSKTTGM